MILDLSLHDCSEQKSCPLYYFHGILEKALGYDIGYCFNPEELLDSEGNYKDGIYAAMKSNDECVPVTENDRIIDFLPFTHIFERGFSYLGLTEGAELIVNTYPKEIQQSMCETHPTCMSAVPRFWEKVYVAVKSKMDNSSTLQ